MGTIQTLNYLTEDWHRGWNTGSTVALRLAKCVDDTRTTVSKLSKIRFVCRQTRNPYPRAQRRDRKECTDSPARHQRHLVEWTPVTRPPDQPTIVSHLHFLQISVASDTSGRLLKVLRQERDIMSSLTSLGLTPEQAVELVSHESILAAQREGGTVEGIFDAGDREEGDIIVWWNDIEKDQMYATWSDNIQFVSVQEE